MCEYCEYFIRHWITEFLLYIRMRLKKVTEIIYWHFLCLCDGLYILVKFMKQQDSSSLYMVTMTHCLNNNEGKSQTRWWCSEFISYKKQNCSTHTHYRVVISEEKPRLPKTEHHFVRFFRFSNSLILPYGICFHHVIMSVLSQKCFRKTLTFSPDTSRDALCRLGENELWNSLWRSDSGLFSRLIVFDTSTHDAEPTTYNYIKSQL